MSVIGPGRLTGFVASATIAIVSAARVRLPPRRRGVRLWGMRLMGVTATSALLAIFAWALLTFYARARRARPWSPPQPAATPAPAAEKEKAKPKKAKPKLTPSQRRDRAAAVATLGDLGYRPVTLKTYAPDHVLRVLIGKGEGGKRAFFFDGATLPRQRRRRRQRSRSRSRAPATAPSRSPTGCSPRATSPAARAAAKVRVLFRWDGEKLAPQTAIPPSGPAARAPPRSGR